MANGFWLKNALWSLKLVMTIQYSGMITIRSQIQPEIPPSQVRRSSLRAWNPAPRELRLVVRASLVATAISGPFLLACRRTAAEPPQDERQDQTEYDEDGRDHARRTHLVGHESALVHVEGKHPGR